MSSTSIFNLPHSKPKPRLADGVLVLIRDKREDDIRLVNGYLLAAAGHSAGVDINKTALFVINFIRRNRIEISSGIPPVIGKFIDSLQHFKDGFPVVKIGEDLIIGRKIPVSGAAPAAASTAFGLILICRFRRGGKRYCLPCRKPEFFAYFLFRRGFGMNLFLL